MKNNNEIMEIYNQIIKNGGATLEPQTLENHNLKNGFMVSLYGYEKTFDIETIKTSEFISTLKEYQKMAIQKGGYVGLWVENGLLYFDISECITNISKAKKIGRDRKQISIYNIKDNEYITLDYETYTLYAKNDEDIIKQFDSKQELYDWLRQDKNEKRTDEQLRQAIKNAIKEHLVFKSLGYLYKDITDYNV